MTLDEEMDEDFQNHVNQIREAAEYKSNILSAIPTNWLDPLLTGQNSVLPPGHVYTPKDIERLLLAIRKRLEAKLGI